MTSAMERVFGITGKVAVVTGGGRGIGQAVCRLFGEAGATVIVTDIDAASAARTAAEIGGAHGRAVDVSSEADVTGLFAWLTAAHGGVDIIVHGAAIFPKRAFLETTVPQWDAVQAVNVRGTFLMMREGIRTMKAQNRGGAIVNISSIAGERASSNHNSAYCASKAAVTSLTRTMALETGADNIRINAVLPGGVLTEGARHAVVAMREQGLEIGGPATMPGRMPLGRIGEPEDIAAACLFLASPAASYITGQSIAVDGGFLIS